MNTATGATATITDPSSFFSRLSESIEPGTSTAQINQADTLPPRLNGSALDGNDLRKNIQANVIVLLNAIDRAASNPTTAEPKVQRGIGEAIRIINAQLNLLKSADPIMFSTLNQAFESSLHTLNTQGYGYDKTGYQS